MKQIILKNKKALAGIVACLVIGGITMSFQDTPFYYRVLDSPQTVNDTFPKKHATGSIRMKDFDKLQQQLDENMLLVNQELKKIDVDAIQKQIELSLKEIDIDKIRRDVELSLKDLDVEKMMADVRSSLKDVNWDKTNAEMKFAMEDAKQSLEKAKEAIKKINTDEIKKEMDNAKLEMEKSRDEINKIDINKIMAESKQHIEKAKEELNLVKAMFNEMEKDGLISKKDGFTIEYKNKDLYINGLKQKEQVTDKYRKYFKEDHFTMTIDKEDNSQ